MGVLLTLVLLLLLLMREALRFLSLKRVEETLVLVLVVRVVFLESTRPLLTFLLVAATLLLFVSVDFLPDIVDLLLTTLL